MRESIACSIAFAENDQSFVDVADFNRSQGSEDRSNQGDFIG
jgi:hypothetical protein